MDLFRITLDVLLHIEKDIIIGRVLGNSNILDLFYTASNKVSVELKFQAQIMNDDGSVTMSTIQKFTFLSSQTVDIRNGRSNPRTTPEISRVFFLQQNSFNHLFRFGMNIANQKLLRDDEREACSIL